MPINRFFKKECDKSFEARFIFSNLEYCTGRAVLPIKLIYLSMKDYNNNLAYYCDSVSKDNSKNYILKDRINE